MCLTHTPANWRWIFNVSDKVSSRPQTSLWHSKLRKHKDPSRFCLNLCQLNPFLCQFFPFVFSSTSSKNKCQIFPGDYQDICRFSLSQMVQSFGWSICFMHTVIYAGRPSFERLIANSPGWSVNIASIAANDQKCSLDSWKSFSTLLECNIHEDFVNYSPTMGEMR